MDCTDGSETASCTKRVVLYCTVPGESSAAKFDTPPQNGSSALVTLSRRVVSEFMAARVVGASVFLYVVIIIAKHV